MATTSTEAIIPNSNHPTYRLGHNLINKVKDKIWSEGIVATASTTGFWEPDKEFKIKVKVNELKRKFHQNRYLQIKHLPRDVSEEEIRQMLSDFPISSVILSCGHGSAGSAKAYLEDPEMLEDWDKDRTFLLRGQKIPVSPTLTEMVLCVARYPLSYNESHFTGLVSSYGEVKTCFLMISEKTGDSKGYGFVEYATKEAALHAKSKLDGLPINDSTLCADFIDGSHTTFESLHSKCLYVDNLPLNYRDMGEFRRLFSKAINPPYCQIALKNGCPQNWGLVEFNSGEDAENTLTQLNGCELKGKKLRISYYIPGVRAINLYLKLLNETDSNKGKGNGLLPTPPPGVFQSFKNLQKQNPIFAQSIQNIMVTEQQLGNANANNLPGEDGKISKQILGSRKKPALNNNKTPPGSTPGSESPVNDLPYEQQAALLRLLACQTQNAALLQNPQMAAILKQFKGTMNGTGGHLLPGAIASLENSGLALPTGLPGIPVISALNGLTPSDLTGRGIFVDAVKPTAAQLNLLGVNPGVDQSGNLTSPSYPSPGGENAPGATRPAAGPASLWNSTASIPEVGDKPSLPTEENLLGPHLPFAGPQMNPFAQRAGLGLTALMPGVYPLTRSIPPIPGLQSVMNPLIAAEPPQRTVPQTPQGGFHPAWFPFESPQFSLIPPHDSNLGLLNQNALLQYLGDNPQLQGLVNDSLNQYISLAQKQQYKHSPEKNGHDDGPLPKKMHQSPTNNNLYRSNSNGSSCSKLSDSQNSVDSEGSDKTPLLQPHPSTLPMPIWSAPTNNNKLPPKPIGYEAKWNKANGRIRSTPPPNIPYPPPPWNTSPFSSPPPNPIGTPVGQKRKYNNFLPSPEPSPEGNYIGQHSQGIGGHYPDSWSKRKKKN